LAVDAGELADVCRSLESCGIRGDMEAVRALLGPLERAQAATAAALQAELAGVST
jgi:hypothetical protein